jgi:hypothetical protein
MTKTRKTRKEKIKTEQRKSLSDGFVVKEEWLSTNIKQAKKEIVLLPEEKKYFRADLTKTFFLTMLVVALELALWQYLSRH